MTKHDIDYFRSMREMAGLELGNQEFRRRICLVRNQRRI